MLTTSLGILAGYILGNVLDFTTIPLCMLMVTNFFLAGSIIIHDSPLYLLRKSRFRVRNFCIEIENKCLLYRLSFYNNSVPRMLLNFFAASAETKEI